MARHRWATSPHGFWICPCGAWLDKARYPVPMWGECPYPYPAPKWGDSHPANIARIRDVYRPERTIYILASGQSMNYLPRQPQGAAPCEFWYDKLTIGINEVHRDFPCGFLLAHHGECCQEAIDKGLNVVTSEFLCGVREWGANEFRGHYYTYQHRPTQHITGLDLTVIDDPNHRHLLISSCTVVEAIHLAYHMGSRSVVLCGVDGGTIDGKINYDGYNNGSGTQPDHIHQTKNILSIAKAEFRRRGMVISHLSPFDLGMEGHAFEAL